MKKKVKVAMIRLLEFVIYGCGFYSALLVVGTYLVPIFASFMFGISNVTSKSPLSDLFILWFFPCFFILIVFALLFYHLSKKIISKLHGYCNRICDKNC